jgi:hypothetical protein
MALTKVDTCGRQMYKTALKGLMKHGFIYELWIQPGEASTRVPTPGSGVAPRRADLEFRDGRSP